MKNPFRLVVLVALAGIAMLAACDSDAPGPTDGVLTATLVSPNGPEGAAHLKLFGEGITEVRALDARTFRDRRGDTVNVVVARDQPGDLRFLIALADTTRVPSVSIVEVAGGDDELRSSVQGYRVELRP